MISYLKLKDIVYHYKSDVCAIIFSNWRNLCTISKANCLKEMHQMTERGAFNSLGPGNTNEIKINWYVRQVDNYIKWRIRANIVPSTFLNQCWLIVNCQVKSTLLWYFRHNSNTFVQGIQFENIAWEMSAILTQYQCVNPSRGDVSVSADCIAVLGHQGGLLLTWFNFNPSMDK